MTDKPWYNNLEKLPVILKTIYYILAFSKSSKIILVNRGWIKKKLGSFPNINELNQSIIEIRGLSGILPKVTIRDQEAFEQNADWPLIGSYPTLKEIENKFLRT